MPTITFFGIALVDDTVVFPIQEGNRWVIERAAAPNTDPPVAYGFKLVVEGAPDPTLLNCQDSDAQEACLMGISTYDPEALPDLQIETSNSLGDGSSNPAICDDAHGVAAVNPFDFSLAQAPNMNQFGCRFRDSGGSMQGISDSRDACTQPDQSGGYGFVQGTKSKVQFCGYIGQALAFPQGETTIAVRIRDQAGGLSQVQQLVIRVPAP